MVAAGSQKKAWKSVPRQLTIPPSTCDLSPIEQGKMEDSVCDTTLLSKCKFR